MVYEAGGDRVQIFDVENHQGWPVYVHAKVCIVDVARPAYRAFLDPDGRPLGMKLRRTC